jgi:hypothetical protein
MEIEIFSGSEDENDATMETEVNLFWTYNWEIENMWLIPKLIQRNNQDIKNILKHKKKGIRMCGLFLQNVMFTIAVNLPSEVHALKYALSNPDAQTSDTTLRTSNKYFAV